MCVLPLHSSQVDDLSRSLTSGFRVNAVVVSMIQVIIIHHSHSSPIMSSSATAEMKFVSPNAFIALSSDDPDAQPPLSFSSSSWTPSLSSSAMSVSRRVGLAPIYCSWLVMVAPSLAHAIPYTQKKALITLTITITIASMTTVHVYLCMYLYRHLSLSLFVLPYVHVDRILLSVHVVPMSLSMLDVLVTAFQMNRDELR